MQLFGRNERKAFFQLKPELITKNCVRSNSRAVGFDRAVLQDFAEKIEIGFHRQSFSKFFAGLKRQAASRKEVYIQGPGSLGKRLPKRNTRAKAAIQF